MNNEIIIPELKNETIESMIYVIRGQKVMLDFELARIYGYETKRFNEQVKNNIERFDNDFRFQLTNEEFNKILMSKKSTSSWGGTRKLPYAFTEQGIYMLMTVLKGELAVKQSKVIIRIFKQMKDYIIESKECISIDEMYKLIRKVDSHSKDIIKIKKDYKELKEELLIDNNRKEYLFLNNERIEADIAYQEIYKQANNSIYIIDDYIDIKTLQLLKVCKLNINIIIFSDNKAKTSLNKSFIDDFVKDTNMNISFKITDNKIHDRFIILDFEKDDEIIYLCGSSSKDSGSRITTITKIETTNLYSDFIRKILQNEELIIK